MSINNQLTAMHDEYRTWRVAIVHDWLVVNGGAEKVLSALLQAFPQADLHTLVNFLPAKEAGWLQGHRVVTSVLQRMPLAKRFYRHYLPLMPYAVEQFDLRGYDLVISSSHAVAKGVVTHPGQQHICYCHTPMRYAWDMKEDYLEKARFRLPLMEAYVRKTLKQLRQWDYFTSNHVDYFIANSHNVANRIQKYYRRDAQVLYPPVDTEQFLLNSEPREGYYLAASRLVPYKRLDLIIEAFKATPHRHLKVVGDGSEFERLKLMARAHDHIELLGYQPDEQLIHLMSHAQAYIFAADEDFGILPLEAQSCGTPVIAYGKGGALETVKDISHGDDATGVLFEQQTPESLLAALEVFETQHFQPRACRQQAEQFSYAHFWQRLHALLDEVKSAK